GVRTHPYRWRGTDGQPGGGWSRAPPEDNSGRRRLARGGSPCPLTAPPARPGDQRNADIRVTGRPGARRPAFHGRVRTARAAPPGTLPALYNPPRRCLVSPHDPSPGPPDLPAGGTTKERATHAPNPAECRGTCLHRRPGGRGLRVGR